jgi:hypothetical protein
MTPRRHFLSSGLLVMLLCVPRLAMASTPSDQLKGVVTDPDPSIQTIDIPLPAGDDQIQTHTLKTMPLSSVPMPAAAAPGGSGQTQQLPPSSNQSQPPGQVGQTPTAAANAVNSLSQPQPSGQTLSQAPSAGPPGAQMAPPTGARGQPQFPGQAGSAIPGQAGAAAPGGTGRPVISMPASNPASDGAGAAPTPDGAKAFVKAKAMGDALKSTLQPDALPNSAAGGNLPGAPSIDQLGTGTADPAHPATPRDLLVASLGGFKSSFDLLGMKAVGGPGGAVTILGPGGRRATSQEIQRLAAQIRSDPSALLQYPNLFSAISRERFASLKSDYAAPPSGKGDVFKDVSLSEGRDLDWGRSCNEVSGDCNRHVNSKSYRQGSHVSPDDLSALWNAIHEDAAKTDGPKTMRPDELAPPSSFIERLEDAAKLKAGWLPWSGASAPAAESVSVAGPSRVAAAPGKAGGDVVPPSPATDGDHPAPRSSWLLWSAAAGVLAFALFFFWRRSEDRA